MIKTRELLKDKVFLSLSFLYLFSDRVQLTIIPQDFLYFFQPMPGLFWLELREHYLVLRKLMRLVNDELSALILLACANNMYFICFQLFNSFV